MMNELDRPMEKLLSSLQERAKELNCLYEVEQVLANLEMPLEEAFLAVVEAIPDGWQYPDVCEVQIEYNGRTYRSSNEELTEWVLSTNIEVQDEIVGRLVVYYVEERPREAIGPFLAEEDRLIRTIAERLGHSVLYQQLREMRAQWESAAEDQRAEKANAWRGPVELLRRTDRNLYLRIARKMVNHLCSAGVEGGQALLQQTYGGVALPELDSVEQNVPGETRGMDPAPLLSGRPFELASAVLGEETTLGLIQAWIMEDRASFLPRLLNNPAAPPLEVAEGIRRFHLLVDDGAELSESTLNGLRVSLIRRFFTEQLDYISVAKDYIDTWDFVGLLDRMLSMSGSYGKVGGKTAGLLLAAKILDAKGSGDRPVGEVRVPKSWYVASEVLVQFIEYNELEELLQQKYREIAQIRHDYPNVVQLFKNSRFPPEFVKCISAVLDGAGDTPLIVRSSSLLEDRLGSAFSGKYKSLFLANQGTRAERGEALLDAISEVLASVFGPDPIAYRRERGLLDFHEEMGILIQEVVGRKVGDYFLPAFGGVAFSNNELRWSSRIRREDGLIRLVPGLGTRAVDRVADDYPIMVVPGQPNLKVNTTIDEVVRYSPKQIDVINLKNNSFETKDIRDFIAECGSRYPAFQKVFSVLKDDVLRTPSPILVDAKKDELVADFGGVISSTPFVRQIGNMLKILEEALGSPVDIEFAVDGNDFYLLQCRPQSFSDEDAPAPIPKDLPDNAILFAANRYVSNGWVPDISHVVYVDPDSYGALEERSDLLAVGKAVGELNKRLPKRQFILMGPGRWGSRGDIKLGVRVSYSDINNTAMLIEIAKKAGNFVPDLSFGTHFFQDLVESGIRYLPLYPDDPGGKIDHLYLQRAPNLLAEMLPEYAHLEHTVRVIDVAASTRGKVLRILMNSELDEAIGLLTEPDGDRPVPPVRPKHGDRPGSDEFWRWRMRMAERIASEVEAERFGVEAIYIIGSTKNASAGPSSDIDLVIHFRGDERQQFELLTWLEGWSLCLGEINYLRTGYQVKDLLDVHLVTDEDITKKTSFAAKIGAITDPARELPLGGG